MTKRFAHIHKLVELRRDIQVWPDNADRILRNAIIQALPPGYHKVYDWIGTCYAPVNTAMVMKAWDLKPNHASTILKELWEFGLLKRTETVDRSGRVFMYTQAE
jgi:hypothetical protein